MFCGCPVRGEQNGMKISYYWGNYLIAPVITQEQKRCLPMTVMRGRDQIQELVAVEGLK
jgi:hypothetical protein